MIAANVGDKPRYVLCKQLAGGKLAWFWNPPSKFRKRECPLKAAPLGSDLVEAFAKAKTLNDALDQWRLGEGSEPQIREGTLDWIFEVYRGDRKYRALSRASKAEYERGLARFGKFELKKSRGLLGKQSARAITPSVVDAIYDRLVASGLTRQAELAVTVCGIAWRIARRKKPDLIPELNPFEGVDRQKRERQETEPATYEELISFCEVAVDLGYPELAFAARACFDLLIRPTDVFTRLTWADWRPSERPDQVYGHSGKNRNSQWVLLEAHDSETGELAIFYPELERYASQLELRGRKGALMVLRPKIRGRQTITDCTVWAPYSKEMSAKKVREIRVAAGLPEHITMASFRHGGLTELGDGGLPDTYAQALSRHRQRSTLDHYIHRTNAQQLAATKLRLAHRNKRA